jgi:hypothetical protein
MTFSYQDLDKPINNIIPDSKNTETLRKFITNTEDEFGLINKPVDSMKTLELTEYVKLLDDLWNK